MSKKFWIALILVVVGFMGFIWLDGGKDATGSDAASGAGTQVTHITGKQDAAVKLVEYSDFQCPACGAWNSLVEEVTSLTSQAEDGVENSVANPIVADSDEGSRRLDSAAFPSQSFFPKVGASGAPAGRCASRDWSKKQNPTFE